MPTAPRIALATAAAVATLDEEGQLLARELARRGAQVEPAVWDDPGVDWVRYDLVVVRSTWDYPSRREEFLQWAEQVAEVGCLANEPSLLRWSTDKIYLDELARAGLPVVPSVFIRSAEQVEHAWLGREHVVKPSVSAGSLDTKRLGPADGEESMAHVRAILAGGRVALVQPYLDRVDTDGESALLFVDGRYSHAVRKAAILTRGAGLVEGLFAEEEISARQPSDAELDLGRRVLQALPADRHPLYCRVDLLPTGEGPRVLEVELAEPSMFVDAVPGAADRFAEAILARAGAARRASG